MPIFIEAPKKVSDWKGKKVLTKVSMSNGCITIPKGTRMFIYSAGKRMYLHGELCNCCGITPTMVVTGNRKYKESKIQFIDIKE